MADFNDTPCLVSAQRRRFLQWIAATALVAGHRPSVGSQGQSGPATSLGDRLEVAAIQMTPKLGDVEANLAQAEQLVSEAASKKPALIMLPEMFTSAAAFDESMMTAIRPVERSGSGRIVELCARCRDTEGG